MLTLSPCFRNSLSLYLFSSLDVVASSGLRINLASSQLLRVVVVGHDDDDDEDDDTPCETERGEGGKKGKGRREEAKRIGRDAFFREAECARSVLIKILTRSLFRSLSRALCRPPRLLNPRGVVRADSLSLFSARLENSWCHAGSEKAS